MALRRTRKSSCKRNYLRGGGTAYYSFGRDMSPGLGAPEVLRHDYSSVARYGMASGSPAGLPGMRGGRYEIQPAPLAPGVAGGVVSSIPCEGTRSTWPGKGGAAPVDSITMNPAFQEQSAGYAHGVDSSTTQIGTPIQIQVPYAARTMNDACKGGKRKVRKANRRSTVRSKKMRKNRKTSRKARH